MCTSIISTPMRSTRQNPVCINRGYPPFCGHRVLEGSRETCHASDRPFAAQTVLRTESLQTDCSTQTHHSSCQRVCGRSTRLLPGERPRLPTLRPCHIPCGMFQGFLRCWHSQHLSATLGQSAVGRHTGPLSHWQSASSPPTRADAGFSPALSVVLQEVEATSSHLFI